MLISMTGFGRAEAPLPPAGRIGVEVRSVNHRFLEVEVRLPEGLQAFEDAARAAIARRIRRGQVRVSVSLQRSAGSSPVVFQTALARRYLQELRRLQRQLKLPGTIGLETVLALPQVVSIAERDPLSAKQWPAVDRAIQQAVSEMIRMRSQEGMRLRRELLRLAGSMERLTAQVRRRVPEFQKQAQKRLAGRVERALRSAAPELAQNPAAILAEAASLIQASDVSEELARLDSHGVALKKTLFDPAASAGRTIDFLAQEMHREVNTLGTKLRDPSVLRCVVAMKGQIEKLREQAANVE